MNKTSLFNVWKSTMNEAVMELTHLPEGSLGLFS